jgi:toxin ParE1/3/4
MARIIISDSALKDLREIQNFIARDSIHIAKIFIEKLINNLYLLESFPYIGKSIERLKKPGLRVLTYRSYRILYRVDEKKKIVVILTIVQGSRLIDY